MEQHFIVCGLGYVGWRVLDYLRAAGAAVVAIDTRCAPTDPRLDGEKVIDVALRHELLPVAHAPAGLPVRFLHDVDAERPLVPGDRLVVCAEPRKLQPLLAQTQGESLPELLWANLTRRLSRVV